MSVEPTVPVRSGAAQPPKSASRLATRDLKRLLDMAARGALRAWGDVEPNPLVGAVIVREEESGPRIIGAGHHRKYGQAHAEIDALNDCLARKEDPRGATMLVTLEPCNHSGKTPPCSQALIKAGLARVICARRDPNPEAGGGADVLRRAGVDVLFTGASRLATSISDPFVKRVTTGLPWVIAKWAQTIDGKVATRERDSKWISGEVSRRRVHRLRACVDAILTAEGTVFADNPMLTARGVARVRRVARRVVVTPDLDLTLDFKVTDSAKQIPTTFFCRNAAVRRDPHRWNYFTGKGVEVAPLPGVQGTEDLDLRVGLRHLAKTHQVGTVLVESGPGLMKRMFRDGLVDEVHVYVAPKILGDQEAYSAVHDFSTKLMKNAIPLELLHSKRSGEDVLMIFRRVQTETRAG